MKVTAADLLACRNVPSGFDETVDAIRAAAREEIIDERCPCGLGDVRMVTDSDNDRCPDCKGYGRIFTRRV